ncbi:hypothetical protein [Roseibium sp. RKSG952]|uniref:hypothetical protein n=1 Tax=Roseibium sp. RKSG952 TaxID=2529384 RepID=UPI0012BD2EAF|nr:hypothetical protein [Roseibium sp. RKSG952]
MPPDLQAEKPKNHSSSGFMLRPSIRQDVGVFGSGPKHRLSLYLPGHHNLVIAAVAIR